MPGSVYGDTADAPVIDSTQPGTMIGLLKGIVKLLGFGSSPSTPMSTASYGLQTAPANLFELTVAASTGVTQKGKVFPTTIACAALPTIGSGTAANLTNGGNVIGGVFSPDPKWDSVLLDFAVVGSNATDTIAIEIGRVKTGANTVAEVLATGVLTVSAGATVGPTLFNPFNGSGHSSVTWKFIDATALTQNNSLGLVLQSLGGTTGNFSQLQLSCHNVAYYYVIITTLTDGNRTTNFLCTMTPQT